MPKRARARPKKKPKRRAAAAAKAALSGATLNRIANLVVNQCLQVKDTDSVWIYTSKHMLEPATRIVHAARQAGADTLVTYDSDDIWYPAILKLPTDWLRQPSQLSLKLHEAASAMVWLETTEDPSRLKKISAERWAANDEGARPAAEAAKKIPSVDVGLSAVTRQRARTYAFNYRDWLGSVSGAIAVDYQAMSAKGRTLEQRLASGREVHVSAPNGTDVRFRTEGRPVKLNDGIIDEEDRRKGDLHVSLPAGNVHLCPIEESVEGTVVLDVPQPIMGVKVQDVTMGFSGGRLTRFEGRGPFKRLRDSYDGQGGDKDRLGYFVIGLNPKAKYGFIHNDIVAGAASFVLGDNHLDGGNNHSSFNFGATLSRATVEVDGVPIVKDGKLVA